MTERSERVPVDLDRLADHAAGVLDGTPQAAEVERLVATDPAWAAAAAALRAADERVRADLTALEVPRMPADLTARLDAALAAERAAGWPDRPDDAALPGGLDDASLPGHAGDAALPGRLDGTPGGPARAPGDPDDASGGPGRASPDVAGRIPGHPEPVSDRPATRRPGSGRDTGPASGRPAPRPRPRRRTLAWAGAAAVLFAVAAGGVTVATLGQRHSSSSSSTAAGAVSVPPRDSAKAPAAPPEAAGRAPVPVPGTISTGKDYTPQTLADAAREALSAQSVASAPAALARLSDPSALAACTSALTGRYGGTVRSVEFARFRGAPAAIVVLDGRPVRVVAVGSRCGQAGTDEIYTTTA